MSLIGFVPQLTVNAVLLGFVFALVATGLALIWGVADIVNFAHGEYMLIAMYVTLLASKWGGIDPIFMVPVNAVLLFVLGYLTYRLVIHEVMDAPMIAQIFATFSLVLIIRYLIRFLAGAYTRSIESYMFNGIFEVAGLRFPLPQSIAAIASLLSLGLLYVILQESKIGMAIRATAEDQTIAHVMGVDTDRAFAYTWGLGLMTVGVAGTLVATFNPMQPTLTPTTWTLVSFASVALGGFGNVFAAAAGGLVISFVQYFGTFFLNPSFSKIYVFTAFIAVLVLKPEGILNW